MSCEHGKLDGCAVCDKQAELRTLVLMMHQKLKKMHDEIDVMLYVIEAWDKEGTK